jgi:hypothetical protein
MNQYAIINLFHIFIVFPALCYLYYLGLKKKLNSTVCRILIFVAVLGIIHHTSLIKQRLNTDQQSKIWVNLIHILIVFPLFIYIGFKCEDIKRPYLEMLLLVAFAAIGYHAFNFIRYYK